MNSRKGKQRKMQKKYNRFKKLKVKITEKRKDKKKMEEKEKNAGKKKNSTELQKPNVDADIYNNNKKCD